MYKNKSSEEKKFSSLTMSLILLHEVIFCVQRYYSVAEVYLLFYVTYILTIYQKVLFCTRNFVSSHP